MKYPIFSIKEMKNGLLQGHFSVKELYDYFYGNFVTHKDKNAILAHRPVTEQELLNHQDRYNKKNPRPLEGIPIGIKDNILVKDMPMTCGSKMLEDFPGMVDATVVKSLRDAGAIICFKTNMDEFAMGTYGELSAYGPVFSQWKSEGELTLAGGSSSGSASAVSTAIVPAALGTETGGSCRVPGAWTGTVALKPTYGILSRKGVTTYASSLDTVGIIANSVENCEAIFDCMLYYDQYGDSTSTPWHSNTHSSSTIKIAVLSNVSQGSYCVEKAFNQVIDFFKEKNITVDYIDVPETEYIVTVYCVTAWSEAMSNLMKFDGIRYGAKICNQNMSLPEYYKEIRTKFFGSEVKRRIIAGNIFTSNEYKNIYFDQASILRKIYCDFFYDNLKKYDFFLLPTVSIEPLTLSQVEKTSELDAYYTDLKTILASLTGCPAISVPIGVCNIHNLPLAVQMITSPFGEKNLLRIAKELEQKFQHSR